MRRKIFSILLFAVLGLLFHNKAVAQDEANRLEMPAKIEVENGVTELRLPIFLTNTDKMVGFQCDLYLPEGFSVAIDEYDDYLIELARTTTKRHSIATREMSDGSLRIVISSVTNATFSGNSGVVLNITIAANNKVSVGNYTVDLRNVVLTDPNATRYTSADVSCLFVVKEAAQPVTIMAQDLTIEYGEQVPSLTYISEGAELIGVPSLSCEATSTSPVGTYPIVISQGSVENKNVTFVNGTLTITKAPLTIAAGTYTMKQGETLPEFTLTYTGFKNGETKDVLTKQPTVSCEATSSSAPGEYPVTVSGAEAQNYEIFYNYGKLVVEKSNVSGVEINETNFPDEILRWYVYSFDVNDDGALSDEEISNVKSFRINNRNIQTLKGIEYFTAITLLQCDYCQLKTLDVSKNIALTSLICGVNQLKFLDVSTNIALTQLCCEENQLTSLDVSGCTKLTRLDCYDNQLTSLNVSGCTELTSLLCDQNQLTSLDVSGCTKLTRLECYQNQIKGNAMTVFVESLPSVNGRELQIIYGDDDQNEMTTVQVAAAWDKGWKPLRYDGNTWLNYVGINPDVTDVEINETNFPDEAFRNWMLGMYGADGNLTGAEIASTASIDVSEQSIHSLKGIEYFTALQTLDCSGNQLTTLDVSKNSRLEVLDCSNNRLTAIDVSKNSRLEVLDCSDNQLTAIDVSNNISLEYLYCQNNKLTSLDVLQNTKLKQLHCYQNNIKNNAMDALVESLPQKAGASKYYMNVIYNENEGNIMTTSQVRKAKAKIWTPRYYDGSKWENYYGSEPVSEDIAINEENFPDANFRNYLLSQTYGVDGVLTKEEIQTVTTLDVTKMDIQDLKGVEFFPALVSLLCARNNITTLDLTKNTKLRHLLCGSNQLTNIDLSNNRELAELNFGGNQLTNIDLSNNRELTSFRCDFNKLTEIDVSKNTALRDLCCDRNQLTKLDVSNNIYLRSLSCYGNKIKYENMDALIESLPINSNEGKELDVIYYMNEENVMTTVQVAAAKAKGWTPMCYDNREWKWVPYVGSEEDPDGIESVEDLQASSNSYYNLSGQRVSKAKKGLKIIRMSDGTIRKVLIK